METGGVALREKGAFPISIATSLALEGAFDILEDGAKYKSPPIFEYDAVWFNLRTIIRNIRGAMPKDAADSAAPLSILAAVITELTMIRGIIQEKTGGRCNVVFYACSYNSLTRLFPKALFKEVTTDKQKLDAKIENGILKEIFKNNFSEELPLKEFDTTLSWEGEQNGRVLIVTHYPFDLLSEKYFKELVLLESHTGTLKKKPQWYTKLHGGKDLVRVPFDKMTVQLFGDSGGLLKPYPIAFRRELLKVAEDSKWSSTTTKDRIILTVKHHRNVSLEILVFQLYS